MMMNEAENDIQPDNTYFHNRRNVLHFNSAHTYSQEIRL